MICEDNDSREIDGIDHAVKTTCLYIRTYKSTPSTKSITTMTIPTVVVTPAFLQAQFLFLGSIVVVLLQYSCDSCIDSCIARYRIF